MHHGQPNLQALGASRISSDFYEIKKSQFCKGIGLLYLGNCITLTISVGFPRPTPCFFCIFLQLSNYFSNSQVVFASLSL